MPSVLSSLTIAAGSSIINTTSTDTRPLTFTSADSVGGLVVGRTAANDFGVARTGSFPMRFTVDGFLTMALGTTTISLNRPTSVSGALTAGDGTASAPSLSFSSDTNTGVYRVEADVVGISAGGSERARFTTGGGKITGSLGIGVDPDADLHVKGHSAFAGSGHRLTTAAVRTTDDTVTAIKTIALADNTTYVIKAVVVAREATNNRAAYERTFAFYREAAGAATLLGSNLLDFTSESNVAWDVTMAASGNNVEIRVTGVAATTIDWTATVEYQAVSTNA